jgi:hypothetical protein
MVTTKLRCTAVLGILGACALSAPPARGDHHEGETACGSLTVEACPTCYWFICQCVYPHPGLRAGDCGTCAPPAQSAGGPKTTLVAVGNHKYVYQGQRWCMIKYECRAVSPDGVCDECHGCQRQPPEFLGEYELWVDAGEDC